LIIVVPFQSAVLRVVEATYFGTALNFLATSRSSVAVGQNAAKIS